MCTFIIVPLARFSADAELCLIFDRKKAWSGQKAFFAFLSSLKPSPDKFNMYIAVLYDHLQYLMLSQTTVDICGVS